jgi:hypothetical protein
MTARTKSEGPRLVFGIAWAASGRDMICRAANICGKYDGFTVENCRAANYPASIYVIAHLPRRDWATKIDSKQENLEKPNWAADFATWTFSARR